MALSRILTLLFLSVAGFFGSYAQPTEPGKEAASQTERYAFEISLQRGHITGMLVTRTVNDEIIGTMVNEFGVTALSFVYNVRKNKIKLIDVLPMLNKWYIKQVLKNDLKYCVDILYTLPVKKKKNYVVEKTEECVSVTNTKRKITYTFRAVEPLGETETIETEIIETYDTETDNETSE